MAKVSFTTGEGERSYKLRSDRSLRIGRDPSNDVILRDAKVSRSHAEIVFERGFFVLHDLGSANGSYVNGTKVRVAPLTDGAELRMGNTHGIFSEELHVAPSKTVVAPMEGGIPDTSDGFDSENLATAPQQKATDDDRAHVHPKTTDQELPVREPKTSTGMDLDDDPKRRPQERHAVAHDRYKQTRYLIDATERNDSGAVRNESGAPLFFFRPHVNLISFVARLLCGLIIITGIAAAIFLVTQQRFVPSAIALTLSATFSAVILSLAPKRLLFLFSDDATTARELSLREETRLPFPRVRFSGRGPDGAIFAVFEKHNLNPLGRRTWWILDRFAQGRIGYASEDSVGRALIRRIVGNLFSALRPNYRLFVGVRRCGFIDRRELAAGKTLLDLTEDPGFTLDRRTAIALALLVTAVEK